MCQPWLDIIVFCNTLFQLTLHLYIYISLHPGAYRILLSSSSAAINVFSTKTRKITLSNSLLVLRGLQRIKHAPRAGEERRELPLPVKGLASGRGWRSRGQRSRGSVESTGWRERRRDGKCTLLSVEEACLREGSARAEKLGEAIA
jgi:hypothetical protein